jgi:hypothetical protein
VQRILKVYALGCTAVISRERLTLCFQNGGLRFSCTVASGIATPDVARRLFLVRILNIGIRSSKVTEHEIFGSLAH